jgi:hypothetical protein
LPISNEALLMPTAQPVFFQHGGFVEALFQQRKNPGGFFSENFVEPPDFYNIHDISLGAV